MAQEIYNEGRVVGMSAYEIYVKQALGVDPEAIIATEREWLASSLAMGSSMILQVNAHNISNGNIVDYILPTNSTLCAANTIIASYFDGAVVTDADGWATKVTNYGALISNNNTSSPSGTVGPTGTIPTIDNYTFNVDALKDYLSITDGIVIQPGTWSDTTSGTPKKDLVPDISQRGRIRLKFNKSTTNSFLIILTGFTTRYVLNGVAGLDGSVGTTHPEDGDFLGPSVFPWSSKIIFTLPNNFAEYVGIPKTKYAISGEELPTEMTPYHANIYIASEDADSQYGRSTNIDTYFSSIHATEAGYYPKSQMYVIKTPTGEDISVLAIITQETLGPIAYIGVQDDTNQQQLYPFSTFAPGDVKWLEDSDLLPSDLDNMVAQYPGVHIINHNNTTHKYEIYTSVYDSQIQNYITQQYSIPEISSSNLVDISYTAPSNSSAGSNKLQRWVDDTNLTTLSLQTLMTKDSNDNISTCTIDQKPNSAITLTDANSNNNISWSALFAALANNQSIDLMGTRLKSAKSTLVKTEGSSAGQCPYLEFGPDNAKKRLYISSVAPVNGTGDNAIPIGSIGIGWGMS